MRDTTVVDLALPLVGYAGAYAGFRAAARVELAAGHATAAHRCRTLAGGTLIGLVILALNVLFL